MNGVEFLASWFTPTVLFCVLNVMIGTIYITSTLKPPHTKDEQPPQLVRVPSFFERVKSFNLSGYQPPQPDLALSVEEPAAARRHEELHHVTRSRSTAVAKAAPAATVLTKSASEKVSREEEVVEDRRRPATARERAAGEGEAVDERADDIINRFRQSPLTKDEQPPPPPQLVRVPSFFERVKSFSLSGYQPPQPDPALSAEEPAAARRHEELHHVTRSKSTAVAKAAPAATVLTKSASEKVSREEEVVEDRRRPATARERAAGEGEAVDERADDFINRFRQQLKLERLDSILRRKCSAR